MSDIARELRECAAQVRRTPIRLDTWIPLQQRAADEIERLEAIVTNCHVEMYAREGEVEALRNRLYHVADVAHYGGLCDLTESAALRIVRMLTLPYFKAALTEKEAEAAVKAAIDAARLAPPT